MDLLSPVSVVGDTGYPVYLGRSAASVWTGPGLNEDSWKAGGVVLKVRFVVLVFYLVPLFKF